MAVLPEVAHPLKRHRAVATRDYKFASATKPPCTSPPSMT